MSAAPNSPLLSAYENFDVNSMDIEHLRKSVYERVVAKYKCHRLIFFKHVRENSELLKDYERLKKETDVYFGNGVDECNVIDDEQEKKK